MYRRNYQGWSYSPLTQINARQRRRRCSSKWAWAMNEGGASEVTPIIHDGVMFLSNTSNTVQALDARTGELIWENRIGPGRHGRLLRHAQPGALSGQGLCRDHRRQALCAGRADRQDRRGSRDRAAAQGRNRRRHRDPRQGAGGHDGLRQLLDRQLPYQRL